MYDTASLESYGTTMKAYEMRCSTTHLSPCRDFVRHHTVINPASTPGMPSSDPHMSFSTCAKSHNAMSLNACGPEAELAEVRHRLRCAQKRLAKRRKRERHNPSGWRCLPRSPSCFLVFAYTGKSAAVAAEFVQGRGWRKGQGQPCSSNVDLVADIESSHGLAEATRIAAVQQDPKQAGCQEHEVVAVLRWLVERALYEWVETQNTENGVAPSRAQLVEQARTTSASLAPESLLRRVSAALLGSSRSQRRWLAKFRARWGLRLGKLKAQSPLSLEQKRAKDCLGNAVFGIV